MTNYEDILKGCFEHDPVSQNKLYNILYNKMYMVCLKYSNSKEDAEEAVNDGFMHIFSKISSFKNYGSIDAWMYTIMKNASLQKTKKKSRTILVDKMPESQSHTDELNMDLPKLLILIKGLPTGYRKIFSLYAIDGLSHDEISRKLKISEGTSKSQLSRAKRKLQEQVKNLYQINTF